MLTCHMKLNYFQCNQKCRKVFQQDNRRVRCSAITTEETMTEIMFKKVQSGQQSGGAGGATTYESFQQLDRVWQAVKNMETGTQAGPAPEFVMQNLQNKLAQVQYDIVICGGTLGIFLACALQKSGLRVAVVERGLLRGRQQEWNISRFELNELVEENVISQNQLDDCINIEFNPIRAGFYGGEDLWVENVLNLGVSPDKLVKYCKQNFVEAGGKVYENCKVSGVQIFSNGVQLSAESLQALTGKMLVDCMGHRSPIVQQARWGQKPDGICIVVGSVGRGFTNNSTADIIYSNSDILPVNKQEQNLLQYFWEAFPAGSHPQDRTTYMFSYMDAEPYRPSLLDIMEDYWDLMPKYQDVDLKNIEIRRILYGMFPTYRDSPLQVSFPRILPAGDASGIQSPLSFGGFGALSRHLSRLRSAICEAIQVEALGVAELQLINAYNPGLSQAWMLQRAMSTRQGQVTSSYLINKLLTDNFKAMYGYGDEVIKPFLQDITKFWPLLITLLGQVTRDPLFVPSIFQHVLGSDANYLVRVTDAARPR
eukprot:TRINITY_DN2162_c0_g1_i2.p1 TRINITY_DN2162_c0_g1~~TRINITY_DN2162_c0_g1_i2.p1  ORF type:complete len:538 (-),score=39.30 TRINITY_DN2162_c0_g1_i2:30-1643(-)